MVLALSGPALGQGRSGRAAPPFPVPPAWWLRSPTLACIIRRESGGNVHDTANPSSRGLYQFEYSTWSSVGGSGDPAYASRAEQTYRAWLLYRRDGWGPWTRYDGC